MSDEVNTEEKTKENDSDEEDGGEGARENEEKEILPGYKTFDDFSKAGFAALKFGIKAANSLPCGENFKYYSCFPIFHEIREMEMRKLMATMQSIVECTGASGSIKRGDTEEKFELLTEANDILLDRATASMDREAGVPREPSVQLITTQTKQNNYGSWNTSVVQSNSKENGQTSNQAIRLLAAKNIHRPQLSFKDKIDNSRKPWVPRIKDKPNALKPLGIYLIETEKGSVFCHPYDWELQQFTPPSNQLTKIKEVGFKSLEETPLIVVEKPQDLEMLLEDLRRYQEIAVDLEHHSYRTFQGITCLMQISTRDTDYLIDTLALRAELHVLNEIFTKPTVLKVFHGADSDIKWIQRDLSLYIVNMFDTHQAAKHLNLPFLSLAYLLKTHCKIDPNKHFQLADWRIRPLPEELMKYAREDTHYLLHIKDVLTNQLINFANGQINVLRAVYDRSTDICKQLYEKPICDEDSYMSIYRKSQKMFNNRQLYALKELYMWRDEVARQEDDSYGYVLPNHMLMNIAETLPREMQGILACCNPIPPLVRQNLLKLHKFILRAREQSLIKPVLEQDIRQRLTQRNQGVGTEAWIWSPHDLSSVEVQANLPCLLTPEICEPMDTGLANDGTPDAASARENRKARVTIFDDHEAVADDLIVRDRLRKTKTLFVSPFERYKRVLPMVAAQEAKEEQARREQMQETQESIERVREHFINVAANVPEEQMNERLSEMPAGNKRKRERDEEVDGRKVDVSTPRPETDATRAGGFKRKRPYEEEQRPPRVTKSVLRVFAGSQLKAKYQKRNNRQDLADKGMLPNPNFNYQAVDFSSFQGGSQTDATKTTMFQQQQFKDRIAKGKKKKKQKIGI